MLPRDAWELCKEHVEGIGAAAQREGVDEVALLYFSCAGLME